jgi:phosphatidate phosphatase APP1
MRNIAHTGNTEAVIARKADYVKRFQDTAGNTAHTGVVREVVLKLAEAAATLYEMKAGVGFNRGITDTAKNSSVMGGMLMFFRTLFGPMRKAGTVPAASLPA